MRCPNCGAEGYAPKTTCAACAWKPGTSDQPAPLSASPKDDDNSSFTVLVASGVIGSLLMLALYIFPGKRSGSWFDFQWSDVLAGIVLAVVCFVIGRRSGK